MAEQRRLHLTGGIRPLRIEADRVIVPIYGRTSRDTHHEIELSVSIGHVPWMVRLLWIAFAAWRRRQRDQIANMEQAIKSAAEIGEKIGDTE